MTGWKIDRQRGSAREFHSRRPDDVGGRSVWIFEVDAPALALGSSQPISDVDDVVAARLGVDVFRRHSGGGAVLMAPRTCVWIDIVLPVGDPLWTADVSLAPMWLGEVWASALGAVGAGDGEVHRGAMVRPPLAGVICFAGVAPGEVSLAGKTVGISQRRTRDVARFQSIALLEWDPSAHRSLLGPGIRRVGAATAPASGVDAEPAAEPAADPASVDVTPVPRTDVEALTSAFLTELDRHS